MLVKEIRELRSLIKAWKREGLSIGYVPTMGALHEGHESLIKRAVEENDKVVVSVFVNPTQFGPNEDYDSYPRDINRDMEICINAGAAIVFNPEPSEMYYDNKSTSVNVSNLTSVLCGAKRPGHFDGVCLVVSKFFNIVTPDKAYFGEKDAQQVAVIKRMVRDLNIDVEIVACPIIREEDGLAKSSRNTYLSDEERKAALVLNRSLRLAKEALNHGERNANAIKEIIREEINKESLAKIDYVEIVDSESLENVQKIEKSILIPIAVYIGKTRLIDNFTFKL
ncbi:pantoate--beta-alanine ligase [Clostridium sp. BL-8]|uniref:pantoate--beta-alanine ligase n=1 Tax=Clostridium sp. BL-8 TaxID=349938 RepID=UPI00098C0467|nr:pantoate--beta-alanine ligase [Clostridium sp. BL-8]OOM80730.1 pantothenate synthetase [Clostridium sp. BL-8]